MYEFEKIALTGKSYARDNGGTCYLFPDENYYRVVSLSPEKIAKGYQVFAACADFVTIPVDIFEGTSCERPSLDDRDVVTVVYQFVTRAKTERGIIDAAARRAYEITPWHYIPACVSAIWGPDTNIVKDVKMCAYDRLER